MTATEEFELVFPCFAINEKGPIVRQFDDGRVALVILTDNDLLERYRQDNNLAGETIQFDNERQLVQYLMKVPNAIAYITVDPAQSTFTISIADFIGTILSRG